MKSTFSQVGAICYPSHCMRPYSHDFYHIDEDLQLVLMQHLDGFWDTHLHGVSSELLMEIFGWGVSFLIGWMFMLDGLVVFSHLHAF